MEKKLIQVYSRLLDAFGPQGWWPAKTRFEVVVGAILAQNTNWKNVESALRNLEKRKLLRPEALYGLRKDTLGGLIRPAGYYNQKAKKLKLFLVYLKGYDFDLRKLMRKGTSQLREELLNIWGIGPETADSILLYALDKPVFVVDAYTRRVFSRMGLVDGAIDYERLRNLFESWLDRDLEMFKEYHALIDELAKRHCKTKPECENCPVKALCSFSGKT